ncbi:ABC transporter substrate-binding protein [Paenibacillus abyssi]|uniref:Peptide ABC transporter substrate-binding protein n=1 Tax=Paenibacillus abyssi TaxID=1340531 RepID=A0A917FZB5_9BACL|nr:ABC transporter substrate-binding protein [Paenibacillus abyssi]GGG15045.1 peptide ABC transporter substrate-binding protein [Paenibacillus abyssi]
MKRKSSYIVTLLLLFSVALFGCSSNNSNAPAAAETEITPGGTLRIAFGVLPTSLDPHLTTANAITHTARQIFESLVTLNSKYEVVPMLAESFESSEDGKTVTFKLRKGIQFHNGKEMKAEDVIASMEKWQEGATAKANLGNSTWEAADEYTVILHVETPSFLLMYTLAELQQFPAIMPKEVIEGADAAGVKEYIGTGPFKFVEMRPNQYLHFSKFEEYKPLTTPADGMSGEKIAYFDDIYYYAVPDDSTKVNGLISGEYDFVPVIPLDALPQIENNDDISKILYPFGLQTLIFNKKEGVLANADIRKAVNMALDKTALMSASFTGPEYYRLDPGLMLSEQISWYTDAGRENYEAYDPEQAKQLLAEAGYNGEPVRILTAREYYTLYNSAVAAQQMLEEIGMNVQLEVIDWPTLLERRTKPDQYEMFFTGFPASATPLQYPFLDSKTEWPGWTNSSVIDSYLAEIKAAQTQEQAHAAFVKLQEAFWDENPVLVIGHYLQVTASTNKLKGFVDFHGPLLWNTHLEN